MEEKGLLTIGTLLPSQEVLEPQIAGGWKVSGENFITGFSSLNIVFWMPTTYSQASGQMHVWSGSVWLFLDL